MKLEEHRNLVKRLNTMDDIHKLAAETGREPEQLLCILTQKVTRDATRRFYQVKRQAKRLLWKYNMGKSLMDLAKEVSFPPVLLAFLIFQENRTPRKEFWKHIREPDSIKDARMRREFKAISEADMMYSPKGNELMRIRGKMGEARLAKWLGDRGITFRTENDLKGKFPKTPDFLLDKPLKINGWTLHWIESKANFGDEVEVRKNSKNQLEPYTKLFGPGMVVYWFDFVDAASQLLPPNVQIVSSAFFDEPKDEGAVEAIKLFAEEKSLEIEERKVTVADMKVSAKPAVVPAAPIAQSTPSSIRGLIKRDAPIVPTVSVTSAKPAVVPAKREPLDSVISEPPTSVTPAFTLSSYLVLKELEAGVSEK